MYEFNYSTLFKICHFLSVSVTIHYRVAIKLISLQSGCSRTFSHLKILTLDTHIISSWLPYAYLGTIGKINYTKYKI